ncbi:hypothetical protein [Pullulanibacillus camelliae]|uniref:hypothetical protein n=1 Tax=Pullulanibacillus camelliae TaxID=1707096 RepID=UPI00166A2753|nr:hypothetical protein [Pullulanibacillus camelliae]
MAIAKYIYQRLQALHYFQTHREHLQLHVTQDGRKAVTALAKNGSVKKTIVLLSHKHSTGHSACV